MPTTTDSVSKHDGPSEVVEPNGAPDWEAVEDISCPLCGYNLRGLTEARCPECGSKFTWDELLDPRRREHPYLFEHHPRRNWWSFHRTFLGGLNPQAFWTTLHPMQPGSVWRLTLYGLIVTTLAFCFALATVPARACAEFDFLQSAWGWRTPGLSRATTVANDTTRILTSGEYYLFLAIPLAWAVMTFLSFLLFAVSMSKACVKTVHVARAVVYSFDVIAVIWIAQAIFHGSIAAFAWYHAADERAMTLYGGQIWIVGAIATYFWLTARAELRDKRWARAIMWPVVGLTIIWSFVLVELALASGSWDTMSAQRDMGVFTIFALGWAMYVGRLVVAFRQYLRFRHSVAVVASSQIIAPLAIGVCVVVFGMLMGLR